MRKLWLTFTAMLLCSIASFAQTRDASNRIIINSPEEFLKIGTTGYSLSDSYILTEDINLGDLGERTASIIPTFSGTFDGNEKTITYQASFKKNTTGNPFETSDHSLFGSVSGTIKYLNVNANVTLGGTANNMNVALICGSLTSSGVIEYCNASGNITSTVNPGVGGGSDAGLLVGESAGIVRYCTGSGNVVGVGYVGGLIGQMTGNASVLACSFSGSVNAVKPTDSSGGKRGSFAGGICGYASNNSTFNFCLADAFVDGVKVSSGISSTTVQYSGFFGIGSTETGTPDVTNSYATGEVNGNAVNDNTMTNSAGEVTGNYYEGKDNMTAQQIVDELEEAREDAGDNAFYFDVVNGEVVLIIGQKPDEEEEELICEAPINLSVAVGELNQATNTRSVNATWDVANVDGTIEETTFRFTLINEEHNINQSGTITEMSTAGELTPSVEPYVLTIESDCSASQAGYSDAITYTFYVNENCVGVSNLHANNVTATTANISWEGDANVVKLGNEEIEFTNGETLALTGLTPATTYTITAIVNCDQDGETISIPTSVTFTTHDVAYTTKQSGNFNDPNTWNDNVVPQGVVADIIINRGHRVTVSHDLVITGTYKIVENNGMLQIAQNGQLINKTDVNVPGIVEIASPQKSMNSWTFIGAPFENNYKLGTIYPMSHDVSVSRYDYDSTKWDYEWAYVGTQIEAGEGYFAWPFYDGPVIFTTYGDVWNYEEGKVGEYNFDRQPKTETNLNNDTVQIEKTIKTSPNNGGNWMALANPYPAKLSVKAFVDANDPVGNPEIIQGRCVYVFRNGTFDINDNRLSTGDILMTEGFFVNFGSAGQKTITFNKGQLSYNNQSAKASANEFIKLTLINGDKKVRAYLAHNENAEQGYDIFDANKLFAPTEIAEPYFVTDGIELMKEEFAELPYYATMNVRSFANDTVSFVVNNIPEGLAVSIIDGEEVIDMIEGGVYTTEILTGENADRFKVLIKKNVGIADVEELEVNITNNNRHISIETTETDLQVEVYNALGQKVLSTKDRNFTLNQVSAGAYLIKAFNNKASKTQKIVVE